MGGVGPLSEQTLFLVTHPSGPKRGHSGMRELVSWSRVTFLPYFVSHGSSRLLPCTLRMVGLLKWRCFFSITWDAGSRCCGFSWRVLSFFFFYTDRLQCALLWDYQVPTPPSLFPLPTFPHSSSSLSHPQCSPRPDRHLQFSPAQLALDGNATC